jgi:hypothetical protein
MLHAKIPSHQLAGASALYRDFTAAADTPVQRWLARFDAQSPAWVEALARRPRVGPALLREIEVFNAGLGVDARVRARLAGLADGSARAVVTGQQPGVLGGPLMTMYKIATAVSLAREIEGRWAVPCVPVFWLGCDDDDFAEVSDLSLLAADLARHDVSIDPSFFRPGRRVGDIAAEAVRTAWAAVSNLAPAGDQAERVRSIAHQCRDFGHAAALAIAGATRGAVLIVDARAAALRVAGRDLLLEYFDREEEVRAATEAAGRELEGAAYHAQLSAGADSGLFLVRDGVRGRIPPAKRSLARAEFAADISVASPGVVARSLLQDALFAPAAVVLGPAEIAYRAQLGGAYRALDVPVPVVLPRLSATYLPPAVVEMAAAAGIGVDAIARDPAEAARAARVASEDATLKRAARAFEDAFAREGRAFDSLSLDRLDARAREKLQRRLSDLGSRLRQTLSDAIEQDRRGAGARWPFLAGFTDMFRKDAVAQERFLSLLVPMLLDGEAAWPALEASADEFVRDALDRRVWHGVYSVP